MAVYTEIDEGDLRIFIAGYDIGDLLAFKGIAEGVENSNFLLSTTRGNYILTLYEKRVAASDLPFFLGLMEHLARGGFSCPTPVAAREGGVLRRLAGRPAAVISFLGGMSVRRPTQRHCAAVGQVAAELHLAAHGFDLRRPNALSVASWRPLFEAAGPGVDSVLAGLADEIAAELDALERNWPEDLPAGVIHADLFPDNVFFLGGELSGVIDFYFACNDSFAFDLMTCVNAWCFEQNYEFNVTKARAMLRAYHATRPLNAAEISALPLLARGSALRFFLTRLYDWLHTPDGALVTKKDPIEFLRKIRFHRDIAGASAYGIEAGEW